MQTIAINGEVLKVKEVHNYGWPVVSLDDGTQWYIFQDSEKAGEAAREYWEDLAQNDPQEFAAMVGEATLVQWGMNQPAGPGYTKVNNLQDWLDLWLDTPEEQWAGYDGTEQNCSICLGLQEELDLERECVCYRCN